jgi:thioredoxin 1
MKMSEEELGKIRQKKLEQLKRKSKETVTSEGVVTLTDSTFDITIKNTSKPVLVDFWAEWCMPCRMMAPAIEELAHDYAGKALFAKINVDENPETAERFNVVSIPFFIVFKNGQPVEQILGAVGRKPLEDAIKKQLKT